MSTRCGATLATALRARSTSTRSLNGGRRRDIGSEPLGDHVPPAAAPRERLLRGRGEAVGRGHVPHLIRGSDPWAERLRGTEGLLGTIRPVCVANTREALRAHAPVREAAPHPRRLLVRGVRGRLPRPDRGRAPPRRGPVHPGDAVRHGGPLRRGDAGGPCAHRLPAGEGAARAGRRRHEHLEAKARTCRSPPGSRRAPITSSLVSRGSRARAGATRTWSC